MRNLTWLIYILLLLSACNSQKVVTNSPSEPMPVVEIEERLLDTLVISAPAITPGQQEEEPVLPAYNPSHTRINDLLHTKLDLRFDWDNEKVLGKAFLTLKPYFYPTDKVVLDAKDFTFYHISLNDGNGKALQFDYDQEKVTIHLDRSYRRDEKFTIFIDYMAHPAATGGSRAITSNQGLFFIKPDADTPDKPRQIWTQGETEWNSRWFPTIDKPNERTTQEMILTVEDQFKTLSNGILISSTNNPDGTRTDYWKMDQPHAPYLFMIAIGEFAVVNDSWGNIPVQYYVEDRYEKDARAIFAHTPEMLGFFSEKLNLNYPWPKYAQVVVRDYVSGAMENTTSVVFGDFVQKNSRELIDNHNDYIVAHEMFHHWFGDYVTCESWANLTMNEGFANYSEYLWFEHKYGPEEADYHLLNEWSGYLAEARGKLHPLINFGYDNKESMFDSHSYNKGGAILHMLRNYVGDEAFWAALNKYLTDNAYQAVEAHDLRLAFEAVTGEDLNWFFNQWYFNQGHPDLNITYGYDPEKQQAIVTVEQIQSQKAMPAIFQLPAAIDIYNQQGKITRHQVMVTKRKQTFEFDAPARPPLITFDADRVLLCESQDNKDEEAFVFQYYNGPKFYDRFEAMQHLKSRESAAARKVVHDALKDNFWLIRGIALSSIGPEEMDGSLRNQIRTMAGSDPKSQIRATALAALAELDDEQATTIAKRAIETDSAYTVLAAGLDLLTLLDKPAALEYASKLEDEDNDQIINTIGQLYRENGDLKYLPFFEKNLHKVRGYSAISFFDSYQALAIKGSFDAAQQAVENLQAIALDQGQATWRRLGATKSLNDMRNEYRNRANDSDQPEEKAVLEEKVDAISKVIEQIKANESNDHLRSTYRQFQLIPRA